MTDALRAEHERLKTLWATGRATRKQIERCMVLNRKAAKSAA